MSLQFCPSCGGPLTRTLIDERDRDACADPACGYVFWNNPTPVVGAVVEHGDCIVLARNASWPAGMFGLITGFLEPHEDPAIGVLREVQEELALDGTLGELIGAYPFKKMNQVILAYHVIAHGPIELNEELAEYKRIPLAELRYWPVATGWAVKDWLQARGYAPEPVEIPEAVRAQLPE